jgi:hypothetical protein
MLTSLLPASLASIRPHCLALSMLQFSSGQGRTIKFAMLLEILIAREFLLCKLTVEQWC